MTEYSRSQKLGVQRKKKNFRSLNVPRFFFLSREEQCAGRTYVIHTSLFFFFVFPAVASVQCVTLVSFFFFFWDNCSLQMRYSHPGDMVSDSVTVIITTLVHFLCQINWLLRSGMLDIIMSNKKNVKLFRFVFYRYIKIYNSLI